MENRMRSCFEVYAVDQVAIVKEFVEENNTFI